MATSSTRTETIVTLEINALEAQALAEVFGVVGGHPDKTSRRHIESIAEAIRQAGFYHHDVDDEDFPFEPGTAIMFRDGTP